MGRLIVSVHTTLDGVMDQQEKWFREEGDLKAHGIEELEAADAVLLGRETYQALSGLLAFGVRALRGPGEPHPQVRGLADPVGTARLERELLGADTAAAVSAVKEKHEGCLISYGCGALATFLAHHGLVDEVRVWLHPVVWGEGVRSFHAGELPLRLRLITASPYDSGVVRVSYAPVAE